MFVFRYERAPGPKIVSSKGEDEEGEDQYDACHGTHIARDKR